MRITLALIFCVVGGVAVAHDDPWVTVNKIEEDCGGVGSAIGPDTIECMVRAKENHRKVLESAYNELLDKAESKEMAAILREAHEAWLEFQKKHCAYQGAMARNWDAPGWTAILLC